MDVQEYQPGRGGNSNIGNGSLKAFSDFDKYFGELQVIFIKSLFNFITPDPSVPVFDVTGRSVTHEAAAGLRKAEISDGKYKHRDQRGSAGPTSLTEIRKTHQNFLTAAKSREKLQV